MRPKSYRPSADEARRNSDEIIRAMRAHKPVHPGETEPDYRARQDDLLTNAVAFGVIVLLAILLFVGIRLYPHYVQTPDHLTVPQREAQP